MDQEEKLSQKSPDLETARGRGKETLFRVTIRNQVDLIAIADRKANIIISINTVVISLVIAILGTGYLAVPLEHTRVLIIPLSLLMLACLISAVFSILAARPNIIKPDPQNDELGRLFFGNYYQKSPDQFLQEIESLLASNASIYRNLIIDMYYNGIVLNRKYKYLRVAYNIFMAGIILCVVIFAVLRLTT